MCVWGGGVGWLAGIASRCVTLGSHPLGDTCLLHLCAVRPAACYAHLLPADSVIVIPAGYVSVDNQVEARSLRTGEVVCRDALGGGVAALMAGDLRGMGAAEMMALSTEGEVSHGHLQQGRDLRRSSRRNCVCGGGPLQQQEEGLCVVDRVTGQRETGWREVRAQHTGGGEPPGGPKRHPAAVRWSAQSS